MKPLPLRFYQRDTQKIARELIGKRICHFKDGALVSGVIVETEAYLGVNDPACHTYQGRRTKRVESMYLPGGHAYTYFIYGIHFCFNVVTQNTKKPEAVLIRALLPSDGIELMFKRRKTKSEKQLCSGPGKLCQALAINHSSNGLSLAGPELWIEKAVAYSKIKKRIQCGPRIGVDYAGEAKNWPLRFFIDPEDLVKSQL